MSSDYKTFYEEQERVRLEAVAANERAYVIATEKAKIQDIEDAKKDHRELAKVCVFGL